MPVNKATLIIADSESDSDMFYTTGFLASDPFVYIQKGEEKIMVASDLEIDRARSQSRVDKVLPLSKYEGIVRQRGVKYPGLIDVVVAVLREMKIKSILVPSNFSIVYADYLRKKGFKLRVKEEPFFESREIKNKREIGYIVKTLRETERVLSMAIDYVRKSNIRGGFLYTKGGRRITSESIRKLIDVTLMKKGCIAKHTIVSCGEESCEPHNVGSGPLRANESIIFDVFPKDEQTGYYADISRTIVRGRAPGALKKMYKAVASAQKQVFKLAKNGAKGEAIHNKVMKYLKTSGFKTGKIKGKMSGFFHGTGHGVGLEVHETPRISKASFTLKTGNIVTVEPGLYYPGIGGVRLEDMILITDDGCINLTEFPKVLEV
ncbi:MAG: M24 family metallopeptidase [Candidatus Scalinduaceae bacterium]